MPEIEPLKTVTSPMILRGYSLFTATVIEMEKLSF